jgi:hypothetical protein
MDPQRYQQIGELYFAALAQRGDRRYAFLRDACAGDEDLRREVALLLEATQQAADDFLESAPAFASTSHAIGPDDG